MNDVFGLANRSNIFASFLIATRKFGYHCVYIFHIILPEKEIWKKIISQTNIFPASVPSETITKVLQTNFLRRATRYYQLGLCG